MKHFFRKALTILTISSSTFYHTGYACGPQLYSEDTRFSIFSPYTMESNALLPFVYNPEKLVFPQPEHLYMDRDLNNSEWEAYGNKTFQAVEVLHIQYNTAADSFLKIAASGTWHTFEGNDWIKWLLKKKHKRELAYLIFAKKIEALMDTKSGWDRWSEKDLASEGNWSDYILIADQELSNRKNSTFLKERYAFQYLKCAYYNQFYNKDKQFNEKAIAIFEKYLSKSNSIVAQWALVYVSELYDDPASKNTMLIKAFDRSNEKRPRVMELINLDEVRHIVSSTGDAYLREIGTVILNITNAGRGLDQIKTVYDHNPDNPYLKLMISREINKLEEWIWSPEILKFWPLGIENTYYRIGQDAQNKDYDWEAYYDSYTTKMMNFEKWAVENRKDDLLYLHEFTSYLDKIKDDENIKKGFIYVALGHTYAVSHQFDLSEKTLKSMHHIQTDPIISQYHYDKNIVMLETYDFSTQRTQDLYSMSLVGINTINQPQLRYRYYNDFDNSDTTSKSLNKGEHNVDPQFLAYAGYRLMEKGMRAEGALMIASSGVMRNEYAYKPWVTDSFSYAHLSVLEKYLIPEDIDKVLAYKKKPHRTMFESFMLPLEWADDNMYLDLKGTLYVRMGEYDKAKEVFEKMPADFWATKYAFGEYLPALSVTSLANLIPQEETGNGTVYNIASKLEIVNDIIHTRNMIDGAASEREKAQHQIHLANAMYNISYYGRAWMVFAYGKSVHEATQTYYNAYNWAHYSVAASPANRLDNYYELKEAKVLYQQVLDNPGATSDHKALATIMLMHCQSSNDKYLESNNYSYNKKDELKNHINSNRRTYLESLEAFRGTAAYKAFKTYCPDLL